jgi:hypothetical protein
MMSTRLVEVTGVVVLGALVIDIIIVISYNDLCQTEEREPRRAPVKPVDNELGDD